MGTNRNGARTYLFVIQKACKLSRLSGFRLGLTTILGPDDSATLFAVWEPFCAVVDALVATDDWFNRKDNTLPNEGGGNEDTVAL
jgi:hypothetical protein